jgi:hypothetical protein
MRCFMIMAVTAAATAMAGCAAGGQGTADPPAGERVSYNNGRSLDQALAGYVPGEKVSCLPEARAPSSDAYGRTVVYRVSGKLLYRNDMGPGCEGLGRGDIMIASTPIGRFCRGDIVQLLDRTSRFPTGGCAFGDFIPYRKAK